VGAMGSQKALVPRWSTGGPLESRLATRGDCDLAASEGVDESVRLRDAASCVERGREVGGRKPESPDEQCRSVRAPTTAGEWHETSLHGQAGGGRWRDDSDALCDFQDTLASEDDSRRRIL